MTILCSSGNIPIPIQTHNFLGAIGSAVNRWAQNWEVEYLVVCCSFEFLLKYLTILDENLGLVFVSLVMSP